MPGAGEPAGAPRCEPVRDVRVRTQPGLSSSSRVNASASAIMQRRIMFMRVKVVQGWDNDAGCRIQDAG